MSAGSRREWFSRIASLLGEPGRCRRRSAVALARRAFAADVAAVLTPLRGYRLSGAHNLPESLRVYVRRRPARRMEVLERAQPRETIASTALAATSASASRSGARVRRVAARDPARPSIASSGGRCARPLGAATFTDEELDLARQLAGAQGRDRAQRALRRRAALPRCSPSSCPSSAASSRRARRARGAPRDRLSRPRCSCAPIPLCSTPGRRPARRRRGSRRRRIRLDGSESLAELPRRRTVLQLAGPVAIVDVAVDRRCSPATRCSRSLPRLSRRPAPRRRGRAARRALRATPPRRGRGGRTRSRPSSPSPRTPRSRFANAELYQRVALEQERSVAILANVADGIVAVDRDGRSCSGTPPPSASPACPQRRRSAGRVPRCSSASSAPRAAAGRRRSRSSRSARGRRRGLALAHRGGDARSVRRDLSGRIFAFRDISSQRLVEQMQSDFVSTVSHQLRAPLTSIYGFAGRCSVHDINFSDEERRRSSSTSRRESERLTAIVDTLLNVARLEAGDLHVELAPIDLRRVVADAVENAARTERTATSSSSSFPMTPLAAHADHDKLRQVLINLVDNARQVLARRRHGHVGAPRRRGHGRGQRHDEGIGIPDGRAGPDLLEVLPRRADAQTGWGTGLGLFIAQGLVSAMGGRMRVRLGRGSRARASSSSSRLRDARRPRIGAAVTWFSSSTTSADPPPLPVNLEAEGMEVIEAADGPVGARGRASRAPRRRPPRRDAARLDGWRVAEELLEDPRPSAIPIVFLTARAELRDQARGLELGGIDYITKPSTRSSSRRHPRAARPRQRGEHTSCARRSSPTTRLRR